MKIAHIAPPWITIPPKNYGGAEAVIYNLVEEQIAQGHDVTLLAPGDARTSARQVSFFPRSLADAGVPWQAHLKPYYHYYKAIEYIKKHRFDILHAHLSSSADMYVYPLMSFMKIETPLITTLHSRFPFDRVQAWTGDADKYYLEWLSTIPIVTISESARAEVPHPLNFVGVIHNGLSMSTYHPTTREPEHFLAWIGRIIPDKGPHHAIRAARAAGIPLVLAGTIDRYLAEANQYFEEQIKPHIDGEQVKYIGPVNQRQKIRLLSRAKGFLNPIEWEEPFGMVMIEAMATGCPVISFTRGAAPELVAHGKSGFLVHDTQEMTRFIPRLAELDRQAVRAHAEQHFSARAMAEKYLKVYQKVIARSILESPLPRTVSRITSVSSPAVN
jgi:glycosyltransferase involved in cell wall biosynthesis